MALGLAELTLLVIVGTLAAIVYSLRILVLLERRIAGMEMNIQLVTKKILKEELKIEQKVTRTTKKAKKKR
ncbi:MAG: hypothetical protein OEL54_06115 [Flavobacteriaceae bacterium]|nr:hypothetical protein [Flavobacteriaceae bacterium]